jgi:hypothetical protein
MGTRTYFDQGRLDVLFSAQHGVASRAQLLGIGMTPSAIHYRTRVKGPWQILLPGIYAMDQHITTQRREMASQLHAGPDGVITGPYAARHYGLRASGPTTVDLLVPAGLRRKSSGFARLIRTSRMPAAGEILVDGGLRFADPARAVADAVRGYRDINDARTVICSALGHNLCTLRELREELADGPDNGAALLRRALADVSRDIWSAAEGDFLQLLQCSDLPAPELNVAIYGADGTMLGIIDAWWSRACVGAEVDSREFHSDEEGSGQHGRQSAWEDTMDRHNRLSAVIRLLHFSPARIRSDGNAVINALRAAIRDGLSVPPREITAIPVDRQLRPRFPSEPMAPTVR